MSVNHGSQWITDPSEWKLKINLQYQNFIVRIQQWIHDFFLLHILGQTLQSVCFLLFVATAPTKLPGPLKIQFFLFNEKFIWLANVFDFFNLKKNYTINKSQPNKVARAPEDFFDFHVLLANFCTKLPGPLLRIRRGTHCQDKVCHCPTPSVILLTILSQTNSEADLVRWVGKPLLPGKSAQE